VFAFDIRITAYTGKLARHVAATLQPGLERKLVGMLSGYELVFPVKNAQKTSSADLV
jgi:hypothetical protein